MTNIPSSVFYYPVWTKEACAVPQLFNGELMPLVEESNLIIALILDKWSYKVNIWLTQVD